MRKRFFLYRTLIFLFIILCGCIKVDAQSSISSARCDSAVGMCGVQSYSFSLAVNGGTAPAGPYYGCLSNTPNSSWFFFQIQDSGSLTMELKTAPARDIDYVLWGPFNTPLNQCDSGDMNALNLISCSNTRSDATNTFSLSNTITNTYYILLVSNYSNQNATLSFKITSGNATCNCDVQCNIYGLSVNMNSCDTGSNLGKYAVSGTILSYLPPLSGTLTISSSCGGSVSYAAPFSTSTNFTIPHIVGKGESCIVTAAFSAIPSCSRSAQVSAPICCQVSTTSPVSGCEGTSIQLNAASTTGGVYSWSGPSSFTSNQQNPVIQNSTSSNSGTYQVTLVNGACSTAPGSVNVTVNPKPANKLIQHH